MGKKPVKSAPAKVDQVYVVGLDANGKPRGARFTIPTICKPLSPLSAMDRAPSKNKGKLFLWG
jgi:hypothetical protein